MWNWGWYKSSYCQSSLLTRYVCVSYLNLFVWSTPSTGYWCTVTLERVFHFHISISAFHIHILLVFHSMFQTTCKMVAERLVGALQHDNQRSVRYLMEWTVSLIFTRFPDLIPSILLPCLNAVSFDQGIFVPPILLPCLNAVWSRYFCN